MAPVQTTTMPGTQFYTLEVGDSTFTILKRYQNLKPIGSGAQVGDFSSFACLLVSVFLVSISLSIFLSLLYHSPFFSTSLLSVFFRGASISPYVNALILPALLSFSHTHAHAHAHAHTRACTHAHGHARTHGHMHTRTPTHTHYSANHHYVMCISGYRVRSL